MSTLLIRADVGSKIGLGHLRRCFSLALALRGENVRCVFFPAGDDAQAPPDFLAGWDIHRHANLQLGGEDDLRQTVDAAAAHRCSGVVVDSYYTNETNLRRLCDAGFFVAAIDDLASHPFPCDLVINGGLSAESLPYVSSSGNTQFLLGPKYALLREEFWDATQCCSCDPEVRNILVTMGGADGLNLTPTVVECLESLPGDFQVTVIIGPFFQNRDEIRTVLGHCRRCVLASENPQAIGEIMREADLAVSAAGQTLYELAVTGVPTIAIQVADNQAGNIDSLTRRGVILPIVPDDRATFQRELGRCVSQLLSDSTSRSAMAQAGRELVDGRGAIRAAGALANLLRAGG